MSANDNVESVIPRLQLGLPREQYDNLAALGEVNWSTLGELAKSPAHYKYLLEHPESRDSDLFMRGIAGHVATLEPSVYGGRKYELLDIAKSKPGEARYWVWPEANGKRGTKAWEAAEAECKKVRAELLREKDHEWAKAIAEAAHTSPAVRELGGLEGAAEATLRWQARSGVMSGQTPHVFKLRGRIDLDGKEGLYDLKSTRNASVDGFMSEVARYEYHAQAAIYVDGYKACTGKTRPYFWIAVEESPPHVVTVIEVSNTVLGLGRDIYWGYLDTLRECTERGEFPPYAKHVVRGAELPKWAMPFDEDEGEQLGATPRIGF